MAKAIQRYVPLFSWTLVLLALLFIPLKIISYGYVPAGDARREVAKAMVQKSYPQIVVLRKGYTMDQSPGWGWVLRRLREATGWRQDSLMNFAMASLLLCALLAGLPWLRRPEAWLAALLAELVAIPELISRLASARPLLLSDAILIGLLFTWTKTDPQNPSRTKLILTATGIALSVWAHGTWYLWILVPAAFFVAGAWRQGLWLMACWLAGTLAGAALTGEPIVFLRQAVFMVLTIYREHASQWLLVGELQPSRGEFDTLLLLAAVFLWRKQQGDKPISDRLPLVAFIAINWILGFKADRFWADWGVPAVLVWLAVQFEETMSAHWNAVSGKRLLTCGLIAVPLFLDATNDLDRRYTSNLSEITLDAHDPALKGWLPGPNGIFYCAQMGFFYDTFYKNPDADWRYILGFEPALMPPDDLKILRRIEWNHGAFAAYKPWIDKMLPQDRLVIFSPMQPDLSELQWHRAAGDIWIGRLPPKEN
jgi:hypothetical protein